MLRSTSGIRRACVVGSTIALIGLTSGLGVLGASAAYAVDVVPPTAEPTTPVDGTGTPTDEQTPSNDVTPTPTATPTAPATDGTDETGTTGDSGTGTPTKRPGAVDPTKFGLPAPGSTTGTTDGTADGAGTAGTTDQPTAAAGSVSIRVENGVPAVGVHLTVAQEGIVATTYSYQWLRNGTPIVGATSSAYTIVSDDVNAQIGLIVTADGTPYTAPEVGPVKASAKPVFAGDPTTKAKPFAFSSTADDAIEQTFTAEGAESYELYTEDGEELGSDPTWYLPFGLEWDDTTGTLSGIPEETGTYEFIVGARNASGITKYYAELTVTPGAAVGILVFSTDKEDLSPDADEATYWIISPDGSISTVTFSGDSISGSDGGRPTVAQGGTLIVDGGQVDQWGNPTNEDEDGTVPTPVITSSVASDVIAPDAETGATGITFPTASTHTITVATGGQTNSFPVVVTPVAAPPATVPPVATLPGTTPAVVVTPTATRGSGQLAYTGSDDSSLAAWALGLLAAGVGVTGLRIARRRAQR